MSALLHQISADARRALSPTQLAERIDRFFYLEEFNRYGREPWAIFPKALAIQASPMVSALEEADQRRALELFFRSVFQSSIWMTYAGIENQHVHADSNSTKWGDPRVQVTNAAVRQSMLIAARISFECLMEFVYFVVERKLLDSKKSKLKKFRNWCCDANNRFGWLVFFTMAVAVHDRDHRTPEVHGTSYVAIEALQCNEWPRDDSEMDLPNHMRNIWPLVLTTLEGRLVEHVVRGPRDDDIFRDFTKWREIDLRKWVEEQSAGSEVQ